MPTLDSLLKYIMGSEVTRASFGDEAVSFFLSITARYLDDFIVKHLV